VIIVVMNVVMATFRSPTVALMPDITPEPLRSKANSIINLMGGLGAILAFLVGSMLYKINHGYPFYMAAAVMIISLIVLNLKIREKRDSLNFNAAAGEKKQAEEAGEKLSGAS
jgi:maltose/moltooligosaccharide transporter